MLSIYPAVITEGYISGASASQKFDTSPFHPIGRAATNEGGMFTRAAHAQATQELDSVQGGGVLVVLVGLDEQRQATHVLEFDESAPPLDIHTPAAHGPTSLRVTSASEGPSVSVT
jgi:hypothetical protein